LTYNQKTFPDNIKRVHATGDTSIETAGPYFVGSNPIKFSDIGRYFQDIPYQTGDPVRASDYFRNTDDTQTNVNVPNATENEFESDKTTAKIAGDDYSGTNKTFSGNGTNLSIESFRGSIKRYYATLESGTYQNYSMGRWSGSQGIDWDNRNHRDTTSRSDGNLIRNVAKAIFINGTCYSDSIGTNGSQGSLVSGEFDKLPGAGLVEPSLSVYNFLIYVNGEIYGSGGLGGYRSTGAQGTSDPGKHGGTALKIKHTGATTFVYIDSNGKIWGGGGGGESGGMGDPGAAGSCGESWTQTMTMSFCPIDSGGGYVLSSGCPAGWDSSGWSGDSSPCAFRTDPVTGEQTVRAYSQSVTCSRDASADYGSSSTPVQGIGGAGGNGSGYNQSRTDGIDGTDGTAPSCSSGSLSGGRPAGDGGKGGDGGDWGRPGGNTDGKTGDAGNGGPAICGSPFLAQGTINGNTLKGKYDGECDGTNQTIQPLPNPNPPDVVITKYPSYARFNYTGMKLMVTAPPNSNFTFRMKTVHFDRDSNFDNVPFSSVQIKDLNGQVEGTLERNLDGSKVGEITLSLPHGEYILNWNNLNNTNTSNGGNSGYSGDGSDGTFVNLGQISDDLLSMNLKDATSPDVDATIEILDSTSDVSSWVRSYVPNTHDTTLPDGSWEYIAVKQHWTQYMRDYAVYKSYDFTEAPLDTYHQEVYTFTFSDAGNQNRKPVGAIDITPGTFKLRMQSDNKARLYWNNTLQCETSEYGGVDNFSNDAGETHEADIDIQMPSGLTSVTVTVKAEVRNSSTDRLGTLMPLNWQYNPAGIAWTLEDSTNTVICNSTMLPGTARLSPAEVSVKVDNTFAVVSGWSIPSDPLWGNNVKDQRFNNDIRLSPGKSILDGNGNPAHNIAYYVRATGQSNDPADEEVIFIK
tara:strand:+ start:2666 stop:5398 length:2733 start_codon:yes stop_codon:yes gene_type:complete